MENAEWNQEASASCQSLHSSLMCLFHTVITKSTTGDRTGKRRVIWCDSRLTMFMQMWKLCRARLSKATCCDTLATTNVLAARGLKANTSWSVTSPPLHCHSFPVVSHDDGWGSWMLFVSYWDYGTAHLHGAVNWTDAWSLAHGSGFAYWASG